MDPDENNRYQPLYGHPLHLLKIESAERYATRLLPFIPRGLPVFQSHGITHSRAIIRYINQFLTIPGLSPTPDEITLLYLAAWFHDIGYLHPVSIHDRGKHADLSCEMIHHDPFITDLVSPDEETALDTIVRYHDSRSDLTRIAGSGSGNRIALMAALFRLADAVDLGADRCPPEVFALIEDGLDEHSRRHWLAHQNILGCRIAYPSIRIMIHDPHNPFFTRRIIPHLEDDCIQTGIILQQYGYSAFTIDCRGDETGIIQTGRHSVR